MSKMEGDIMLSCLAISLNSKDSTLSEMAATHEFDPGKNETK